MSDKTFIYIIVAIVVTHFLFAVGYLIYKIMKAPKRANDSNEQEEQTQSDSF
jgi:hypothetical protein